MRGEKHEAWQVLFDHIKQGHYTFSQICVKGNDTVSATKNTDFLGDGNKLLHKAPWYCHSCTDTENIAYFVWEDVDIAAELSLTGNIKSKVSTPASSAEVP